MSDSFHLHESPLIQDFSSSFIKEEIEGQGGQLALQGHTAKKRGNLGSLPEITTLQCNMLFQRLFYLLSPIQALFIPN